METVTSGLSTIDYVIFGIYAIVVLVIALSASRKNHKSAEGYFLAGKSIPWWAVGASLIAANISAEQFIGMSGSGYAIGMGIAAYEIMAAVTLILVGKYFIPIFIEKGIYTIPEFVEKRFNKNSKNHSCNILDQLIHLSKLNLCSLPRRFSIRDHFRYSSDVLNLRISSFRSSILSIRWSVSSCLD